MPGARSAGNRRRAFQRSRARFRHARREAAAPNPPSPRKRTIAPLPRTASSSRSMKILYSHRTKSADGQYVHIAALTRAFAARGHDVFVCGPGEFGPLADRSLDADAGEGGLRRALPRPAAELAEIAYSAPASVKLLLAARRSGPDILYERYNLFHHAGAATARALRLPFVLEVNAPLAAERAQSGRGLSFKRIARASERAVWRAADAVLPVTEVLARTIAGTGIPRDRITVVPNGADENFLAETDGGRVRARYGLGGSVILGFTGFVRPWHGLDRIVRYISARRDLPLRLFIVGEGETTPLSVLARDLDVEERIVSTGPVQRPDMPAHVATFDIALQPAAVPYASPLKLFEYMAQARAIVAPDQENIREILESGANALLFVPDREEALYAALDALVCDAALRARLGGAARALILKRDLTWSGAAARVDNVMSKLLEARK